MSHLELEVDCAAAREANSCDQVDLVIQPAEKDLGGFSVRRILPYAKQRSVGPFVFFDHMGPADIAPGKEMNVRAHPHIGLSTITYLFSGEIFHKDSLGYEQVIRPGAINFMTAGRGIVHAEKTRPEIKASGQHLHGLQLWMALPEEKEDMDPSFQHFPEEDVPKTRLDSGVHARVMIGEAFGLVSPVKTVSPTLYCEIQMDAGTEVVLPDAKERAVYVAEGAVTVGANPLSRFHMGVLKPGVEVVAKATSDCRIAVVGGDPVGRRHMYWNFVSSSRDKIASAKQRWKAGEFESVPGETEFIPLPD